MRWRYPLVIRRGEKNWRVEREDGTLVFLRKRKSKLLKALKDWELGVV